MRGGRRRSKERTLSVQSLAANHAKNRSRIYPRPRDTRHNRPVALTGTWCAPGIREGAGAGLAALRWRCLVTSPKSGPWKNPAAANGGFEVRSLPSRMTARSVRGKNTGGAPGRRHVLFAKRHRPGAPLPTSRKGAFLDNGQGGFPQRGDEEVYQRVIASTRLRHRRHSGRAQREPEPIGRPSSGTARSSSWTAQQPNRRRIFHSCPCELRTRPCCSMGSGSALGFASLARNDERVGDAASSHPSNSQ
jgi:hypothetical protein